MSLDSTNAGGDMIKVTLDTNLLPATALIEAAAAWDCEFSVVTMTEREVQGTTFAAHLQPLGSVAETATLGEWRLDEAALGEPLSGQVVDEVLKVLSGGAFPRVREKLTDGEHPQLRDALILEAHIRAQRDVLVSDDTRAFVRDGKRETLIGSRRRRAALALSGLRCS
jgi:hypothetical protein